MMKKKNPLRTYTHLVDFLDEEIVWRKKELADLRAVIRRPGVAGTRQVVLIRSGVTMLYAHWEGFIKAAASAYLKYVSNKRLTYDEVTTNFVALGMRSRLQSASQTIKASVLNPIAEFFVSGLSSRCDFPHEDAIKTFSNLSSTVFKEIIHTLNFNYSLYATKEKLIDERLLNLRNNIAHGEELVIDLEEYMNLHDNVFELMETFRNEVDNAASTRHYLRRQTP